MQYNQKTTEQFIVDARRIHNDKYDYSLVEYKGCYKKVKIICSQHGIFEQVPFNHLNGQGCKKCGIILVTTKLKKTKEKFIEEAKEIHGDKYDYSLVEYKNNEIKVKIICKEHGIFEKCPYSHLQGYGCKKCATIKNLQKSNEQFLIKSKKIWRDEIIPLELYKGSDIKIKFLCKKCNYEFYQVPSEHLRKTGCLNCRFKNQMLTNEEFLNKSYKLWKGTIVPKEPYYNSRTKILFECKKCGNTWNQKPSDHLIGYGCSVCNESKGERKIRNYLLEHKISFTSGKTFKECKYKNLLPFDFYLPSYNTCIEYDGEQHFMEVKCFSESLDIRKMRDDIKTKYCIDNGIKLIRIKYTKYDNIETILTKKLL